MFLLSAENFSSTLTFQIQLIEYFRFIDSRLLVLEPVLLLVAELLEVRAARELYHGGRAAHDDQGVGGGGRQVRRNHVRVDEAGTVPPPCGRDGIRRLFPIRFLPNLLWNRVNYFRILRFCTLRIV